MSERVTVRKELFREMEVELLEHEGAVRALGKMLECTANSPIGQDLTDCVFGAATILKGLAYSVEDMKNRMAVAKMYSEPVPMEE